MLTYDNKTKSIKSISIFKNKHNIHIGKAFWALINVEDEDGCEICSDTCECYIYFNHGYQQFSIEIDWQYNELQINNLKLHKGYNTNFQLFEYADDTLKIITDHRTIILQMSNNI